MSRFLWRLFFGMKLFTFEWPLVTRKRYEGIIEVARADRDALIEAHQRCDELNVECMKAFRERIAQLEQELGFRPNYVRRIEH